MSLSLSLLTTGSGIDLLKIKISKSPAEMWDFFCVQQIEFLKQTTTDHRKTRILDALQHSK